MKVKLSALKALFDQVMIFGIEPFKDRKVQTGNEENESEKTKETEEETATTHNLLQLLSGFLDSEVWLKLANMDVNCNFMCGRI